MTNRPDLRAKVGYFVPILHFAFSLTEHKSSEQQQSHI